MALASWHIWEKKLWSSERNVEVEITFSLVKDLKDMKCETVNISMNISSCLNSKTKKFIAPKLDSLKTGKLLKLL